MDRCVSYLRPPVFTCGVPSQFQSGMAWGIHQAQGSNNPSLIRAKARERIGRRARAYLADGVCDGEEEDEKNPDHGGGLGPHAEAVARADGLRDDLRGTTHQARCRRAGGSESQLNWIELRGNNKKG